MDRKKFLRGILGATVATIVGNKLDFIPVEPLLPKPIKYGKGIWEQLQEPHKYRWIDAQSLKYLKEWEREHEMAIWYGKYERGDEIGRHTPQ